MIIEDDPVIAGAIKDELAKWQHEAVICTDFIHVIDVFKREAPKLVLLDIGLPNVNGYVICNDIRRISNVPIIFISSRSEKSDILSGMHMGADDYICKPIDLNITVSKIIALLRRTYELQTDLERLSYKDIALDIGKSCVHYQSQAVDLTFTELQIMTELVKNAEVYSSKNQLIETCWKGENFIDDNALAVNMTRLRKKLGKLGLDGVIETKRNVGYRIINTAKGDSPC